MTTPWYVALDRWIYLHRGFVSAAKITGSILVSGSFAGVTASMPAPGMILTHVLVTLGVVIVLEMFEETVQHFADEWREDNDDD